MSTPKNDKWFQYEALDRTHMLLVMLQESLGFYDPDQELSDGKVHPGLYNEKCVMLLSKATSALAELYCEIGNAEFEDE